MLPVNYNIITSLANFTRPANTTAYAASGQSVGTTLTFNASQNQRGGFIRKAVLTTNNSAHTGAIRLYLLSTAPSAPTDQSVFALTYSQGQQIETYFDFTTWATIGAFAISVGVPADNPAVFRVAGNNQLFGLLEARSAWTPASAQQFAVRLYSEVSA